MDRITLEPVEPAELTQVEGGFGGDSTFLLILAVVLIGAGIQAAPKGPSQTQVTKAPTGR